ncbi:unnamed protein product [Amoebophrya sp. A25]|nr:unnamed protein product [Amoebophrya sp. A25]|eukprot:GSA25T00018307001.1
MRISNFKWLTSKLPATAQQQAAQQLAMQQHAAAAQQQVAQQHAAAAQQQAAQQHAAAAQQQFLQQQSQQQQVESQSSQQGRFLMSVRYDDVKPPTSATPTPQGPGVVRLAPAMSSGAASSSHQPVVPQHDPMPTIAPQHDPSPPFINCVAVLRGTPVHDPPPPVGNCVAVNPSASAAATGPGASSSVLAQDVTAGAQHVHAPAPRATLNHAKMPSSSSDGVSGTSVTTAAPQLAPSHDNSMASISSAGEGNPEGFYHQHELPDPSTSPTSWTMGETGDASAMAWMNMVGGAVDPSTTISWMNMVGQEQDQSTGDGMGDPNWMGAAVSEHGDQDGAPVQTGAVSEHGDQDGAPVQTGAVSEHGDENFQLFPEETFHSDEDQEMQDAHQMQQPLSPTSRGLELLATTAPATVELLRAGANDPEAFPDPK